MQKNIEDIKAKILELAISGKLVKQDSTDETAEILYEKIQEEKEKLIKEKKIRRINLEEIKEEEIPFELPDSWKWVKLEDISATIPDKKFQIRKKDIIDKGTIPVISQSKELIIGYSDLDDKICTVDNGVIIFGDHTRIIKYINFNFIVGADGVKIIKPFNQLISEYFHYSLIYNASITENRGYSRHFKYFKEKLIALPPLNEQKRIVTKIDELFSLIDNMTQVKQDSLKTIDLLEEKVLDLAIKGKLLEQNSEDEPADILYEKIQEKKEELIKDKKIYRIKLDKIKKDEIPFEIPPNWKWVRLGNILNILTDYHANGSYKVLKENVELLDKENYAIMLRITNLGKNGKSSFKYITEDAYNFLAKSKLGKNDIVMTKITDPGVVFLVPALDKPMSLAMNLFLLKIHESINSKYIYYYLQVRENYIKTFQGGTSTKTITKKAVNNLIISLPPLNEQKRIVAKLDTTIHYLNEMREKLNKNK